MPCTQKLTSNTAMTPDPLFHDHEIDSSLVDQDNLKTNQASMCLQFKIT